MPTDDLNNIEAKLNFSKRLGGLIKGHQQEMQQVLDENEDRSEEHTSELQSR